MNLFARLLPIPALLFALNASCSPLPGQPQQQLFDGNWDDLSIYAPGLVDSEKQSLELMQDATVYHLDVDISPGLRALTGREQVRYTNRESVDLDTVYFRLFPNVSGGNATVAGVTVDSVAANFAYENERSALRVTLPGALKPRDAVTLQLEFSVDIPQTPGESLGLFGYFGDILALDTFYPAIAVFDESGWHTETGPDYGDRTFFDASFYLVRVTAPVDLVLVASGSEVRRETKGGKQSVTVAAGPARDFYMAASSRFTKISSRVGETTFNSYTFPEHQAGPNQALTVARNALSSYGRRLGDYPYTELDIVPLNLSEGAAGIEYPGLFGVSADITRNDIIESTVAHEAGHQWFYNVVGDDQVNEPWLDESLTQYITGLYYLDRYGEIGWRYYRQNWISEWNIIRQQEIPIGLPVASYNETQYGSIVYGRGPLFIGVLADRLGKDTFDACLRQYYQSNKWQIVTTDGFKRHFEACSSSNLDSLFSDWVLPRAKP